MRIKLKFAIILFIFFSFQCKLPELDRFALDFSTFSLFFNNFLRSSTPSIGGQVSGLQGSGLRLNLETSLNGSLENEQLDISSNGGFLFRMIPKEGSTYTITILSQPTAPTQVCEVGGATGTVGQSPIRNVLVQCGDSLDLALPTFSPAAGEFPSPVSVSISTIEVSAKIFYRTDGSNPACNPDGTGIGTEYITPINIPQPSLAGVDIRAIVCLDSRSSAIQTGLYRVTNGQLGMVTTSLDTNPSYNTSPQSTTLSPPLGTTIHYTVDGSIPTCSSQSTPNPVEMLVSTTIRAIACAPDYTASPVAIFPYIIQGTVDTPTITAGGNFNNDRIVSMSVITPGASIRYATTTDASDPNPNCTSSTIYTAPIAISQTNTRLRAIGCLAGWTDSLPTNPIQVYNFIVANPVLSPTPPVSVQTSQVVSAISATASATFHYTTDGSNPNCFSPTTPPTITADNVETEITVRVIACRFGFDFSSVVSGVYTKTGTLAPPTFTPVAGTYTSAQNVTINQGAGNPPTTEIRYRTDGFPASCSDTIYGSAIPVSISQTITAISCRTSPLWNPSTSVSAGYTITGTLATPTFTPIGTIYNDTQSVTISSNAGAMIYYNLAVGSTPGDPSCGSGLTTQPISITQTDTRIRAIACLTGWTESLFGDAIYTLRPDTPVPNFASGHVFGSEATITFTSSLGAELKIVEGPSATPPGDPVCTGPYSNTITIPANSGTRVVKARACRTNFEDSIVFTGTYTVNGPVSTPNIDTNLDAANRVTATPVSPPATANQILCYRYGTDPQCSNAPEGAPDTQGGFCALGSTAYNSVSKPVLTAPTDFRIRGCSAGFEQSSVAMQTFTISGTVGAVSTSPPPGVVNSPQSITLSALDSDIIYYRLDGTNPDCTGVGALTGFPFNLAPVDASGSRTILAIGCAAGRTPSAVAVFSYTFQVATPTTASVAGTKFNDESVTIAIPTTTPMPTSIRYNLNGTVPADCNSGTLYSGPILLPTAAGSPNVELRAIGCKDMYTTSIVLNRDFTFETQPPIVKNDATNTIISVFNTTTPPLTIRFETQPSGGRICLHRVNSPDNPAPTCEGTTGNCGIGMIDFGTTGSGTTFFDGAVELRTSARVCKPNYNAHTTTVPRNFLPPAVPNFRIFVSNATFNGDLREPSINNIGYIGADNKCNIDINRPTGNVPYLAMIYGGTSDRGIMAGAGGNPFIENSGYLRTIGNNETLFNTTSPAHPPLTANLDFAIGSTTFQIWTGFINEFEASPAHCNNWTDGTASFAARRGTASASANPNWYNSGFSNCDINNRLYCVESRYRMWVTNSTYDGDLDGSTGADAKCNDVNDSNHPKSGVYKAFIFNVNCVPNGSDWVFKPYAAYYRTDRTTLIGRIGVDGRFIHGGSGGELLNSINTSPDTYWTGTGASFTALGSCFSGTPFNIADSSIGTTGISNATNGDWFWLEAGAQQCASNAKLLCIEQ